MRRREAHIGEDVALGLVHQLGELLDPRAQLVGDLSPLGPGGLGIVLGEGDLPPEEWTPGYADFASACSGVM
jgi:hypothetical protein